jgi:MFS family permease
VGALLLLRHARLLIFYLTQHWLFNDSKANVIYGAYGALVYIMPVLGGYVADRYLGQRKAVLFGATLLTIGHLLMAFEGSGGQGDPAINIFWAALAFIIVGSGFLKANISGNGRAALPDAGRPPRRRLYDLLHGHQRRRGGGHHSRRLPRPDLWLGPTASAQRVLACSSVSSSSCSARRA